MLKKSPSLYSLTQSGRVISWKLEAIKGLEEEKWRGEVRGGFANVLLVLFF